MAVLLIWGGGSVAVWGQVLRHGLRSHRLHRDARSRRELLARFALFIVALGSALAVILAMFGESGSGLRSFATAVALGMFAAAGIVMAMESNRDGV